MARQVHLAAMMTRSAPLLALFAVVVLLAACITNPQPEPLPLKAPDVERVFLNDAPGAGAGLPGAAEFDADQETEFHLHNLETNTHVTGLVQPDGSFFVHLDWHVGEPMDLWLRRGDRESPRASVPIPSSSPTVTPPVIEGVADVSETQARVFGECGTMIAVVGNQDHGWAASARGDEEEGFSVTINAQSGDWLVVFFVATRSPVPGDTLQVPEI